MPEITPSQLLDYLDSSVSPYDQGHTKIFMVRIGPRALAVYISNSRFYVNEGSVKTTFILDDDMHMVYRESIHGGCPEHIKGTEFIEALKDASILIELILSHHQPEKLKNILNLIRNAITKASPIIR